MAKLQMFAATFDHDGKPVEKLVAASDLRQATTKAHRFGKEAGWELKSVAPRPDLVI